MGELQEETGYAVGKIEPLNTFFMSPGYCDEEMHAFLATEISTAGRDDNIQVVRIPLVSVLEMIKEDEIRDAKSIAFLLFALTRN